MMRTLQAAIIMRRAWEDQPRSASLHTRRSGRDVSRSRTQDRGRIPPRQLKTREMIEDYFREHPGEQIPVVAVRNYLTAQGNEITPRGRPCFPPQSRGRGSDRQNQPLQLGGGAKEPADGPQHDPLPAGLSQRLARLNTSGVLGGADTQ